MNTVGLVGTIATDPTYTDNDDVNRVRLIFNIRVRRPGRNAESDFFSVAVFGPYAKTMAEHVAKGRLISVTGELRQNRWTDNGKNRERVEVRADYIELLDDNRPSKPQGVDAMLAEAKRLLTEVNKLADGKTSTSKEEEPPVSEDPFDAPTEEELRAMEDIF